MDASDVYVRAWALGCFHSLNYQYPHLSEGADRVGGQLRGDIECPFSGVTKSGVDAWALGCFHSYISTQTFRGGAETHQPRVKKKKKKKKRKEFRLE